MMLLKQRIAGQCSLLFQQEKINLISFHSYLLSPLSSPIGGHGLPTARINLVGMHAPHKLPSRTALSDAIVLSEIAEYALSLRPPVKGQDPFNGFPHLIAYRLVRACQLAEMGYTSLARRSESR
jgi:hypothetical protein